MDGKHRAKITRYIDVTAITKPPLPNDAVRITASKQGSASVMVSAADGARIKALVRDKGDLKVNMTGISDDSDMVRVSLYEE